MIDQVTILGPGLLGASIAMAAKERGLAKRVTCWSRRAETRAKCLGHEWCDEVFDSGGEAVEGSSLVIVCTPVTTIVPLLREIAGNLAADAVVTDVGSTKSVIVREAREALPTAANFVGSHPMAGSERTGMEHARPDLFDNHACIVTPLDSTGPEAVRRVVEWWEALGMVVSILSPEKHDEIVAHISHLPHVIASVLCSYLSGHELNWRRFAGGGLRDTTRIASGDPKIWSDILEHNREEILRAIGGYEEALHALKTDLLNDDKNALFAHLKTGKAYRDALPPSHG